jgi:hypothetical protein
MTEKLDSEIEGESAKPEAKLRRWLIELQQADKREKTWRTEAEKTYQKYKGAQRQKNSLNILWSITETLRPHLYNSPPKPDVRRRFRDADPIGKGVGEVLERSLEYCLDCCNFDDKIKLDVLDALVPGRGISRVRYIPPGGGEDENIPDDESGEDATSYESPGYEGYEREGSEVNNERGDEEDNSYESQDSEDGYEETCTEHIDWKDFRVGPGKTWAEVEWIAFRHRLTKADVRKRFGKEIAASIAYQVPDDDTFTRDKEETRSVFETTTFWEIWHKPEKEVFFVNEQYRGGVIYLDGDPSPPLEFKDFWPIPEPLRLFEDSESNVPTILFSLYEAQAIELNKISERIIKITDALKYRGIYDSTLSEISALMNSQDNDFVPIEQAAMWADKGGIEKAFMIMPIDAAANVLVQLYEARDACKQNIYEITGLGDILRGASDPRETATAQNIKGTWGTLRLQRMQREVQRYIRDLIRLMGEVIANKFSVSTLKQMTGLQFPTRAEKMAQQLQQQGMQQSMQQQQMPGLQPMPPQPIIPTWEDIIEVLHSHPERQYRTDIETDSTVQSVLDSDMGGLKEVLSGIVEFVQGIGPAIMSGAFPIEAAKALILAIARRARMGSEVEDALDEIQAPKPQNDPQAQAQQQMMQMEQQKMQMQSQLEMAKLQQQMQIEQMRSQSESQRAQQQIQGAQADQGSDYQLEQLRIAAKLQEEREKLQTEFAFKQADLQLREREIMLKERELGIKENADGRQAIVDQASMGSADQVKQIAGIVNGIAEHLSKPRPKPAIVRNPNDGLLVAVGEHKIVRDPQSGLIAGVE